MLCEACKREIHIVAKGLCNACYQRKWKTGSTEYQHIGKHMMCRINGCGGHAISNGLCDKHRQRLRDHGTTELKDPAWGAKSKHPLRNAWQHMQRYRGQQDVVPEWRSDFLQFVNDVGERPSLKHKLFAANDSKPIGPDNFVWKRALTERADGEDERTYKARRARAYRAVNPEMFGGHDLKRHYGLSRADYDAMHKGQDGKCAICGCEEIRIINGKKISLSVDHSHSNGQVRMLLCTPCNQGIGLFRDDPDLLDKAATYLRRFNT